MKTSILALIAILAGGAVTLADDLSKFPNPLGDAKVGEWVEYRGTMPHPETGIETEGSMRLEVISVLGDQVIAQRRVQMGEQVLLDDFVQQDRTQDFGSFMQDLIATSFPGSATTIVSSAVEPYDFAHEGANSEAWKVVVEQEGELVQADSRMPLRVRSTTHISNGVPVAGRISYEIDFEVDIDGETLRIHTSMALVASGS